MKNKGILALSLVGVAAIATSAAFVLSHNFNIQTAVKATDKEITFDATHHLPDLGPGEYTNQRNEYTTSIEGSDDIQVTAYCMNRLEGATRNINLGGDHLATFGASEGSEYGGKLMFEIGLNNITHLSVDYGNAIPVFIYLDVTLYDEDGAELKYLEDRTSENDEVVASKVFDLDVSTLSLAKAVRKVQLKLYPWTGNIAYNEMFLNSVTVNWSC